MQTIRLETKAGELVSEIELPIFANGEPDAIAWGSRVFIRRPMQQTEPPKKNSPETYFEAWTYHHVIVTAPNPLFDRVTETKPTKSERTVR